MRLELPRGPLDLERQAELLGALFALLQRYTQQDKIRLDVFVRDGLEERRIALDFDVAGDTPFSSVIDDARVALAAAKGRPARDVGEISNVAATFIPAACGVDGSFDAGACVASARANYDAHFVLTEVAGADVLALAYNARVIGSPTVGRLIESFVAILGASLSDRTTAVERLPLLGPEEIRALTVAQDSGPGSYPLLPVHRRFEALAKKQPAMLAASFRGHDITYAALDERSTQLAHYLVACGVGPEVPVAVCVRPSLDVLVAMVAIWKARGIYLPLDPTHPEALIRRMLDEARPRLVLTSSALSGADPGASAGPLRYRRRTLAEATTDRAGVRAESRRPRLSLLHVRHDGQGEGSRGDVRQPRAVHPSAAQKYGLPQRRRLRVARSLHLQHQPVGARVAAVLRREPPDPRSGRGPQPRTASAARSKRSRSFTPGPACSTA